MKTIKLKSCKEFDNKRRQKRLAQANRKENLEIAMLCIPKDQTTLDRYENE